MSDLKEIIEVLLCLTLVVSGALLLFLFTIGAWAVGIAEMVRWMLG